MSLEALEQVLGKLQEAWMNEKHSPELLEPRWGRAEASWGLAPGI